MVGFGMMDNFVMIQAGDLIDNTIGVSLGLATLTAAASGQIISDFSGVCFGGVIESVASKLGLPKSGLSAEQLSSRNVKIVSVSGAALGVVLGCCIGMTSLLFMDLEKADRLKKQAEMQSLFKTVVEHGKTVVNAEHSTLWLVEPDKEHVTTTLRVGSGAHDNDVLEAFGLWDLNRDGVLDVDEVRQGLMKIGRKHLSVDSLFEKVRPKVPGKLDLSEFRTLMLDIILREDVVLELNPKGVKGQAAASKQIIRIDKVNEKARTGTFDRMTGHRTYSIIVGPVIDEDGEVIALIEMANKRASDGGMVPFTETDELLIEMLCKHAAIFISICNA